MGGNFPLFCKTYPLELFHEFILGSDLILMEKKFRKFSREVKVVVFPMFFI